MFNKFIKYFDGHFIINFCGITIRIKKFRDFICPEPKELGVTKFKREKKIIVSLTSFPERINIVDKTIKTLLTQTTKPDELILWLAEEQFPQKDKELPTELIKLKQFGLTINWYKDIRSYKKIIPTLIKYPNEIIITVDDDIYYSSDTIEVLYNSYLKNPNVIHSNRCDWLIIKNNEIKWIKTKELFKDIHRGEISFKNRLTGYGAVLYPPNCLHKDVTNEELFINLLPTHDDVWLWAMALLNNTKTKLVKGYTESINYIEDSQQFGLCKINKKGVGTSLGDAYKIILNKYPLLLEILKKEQ